MKVKKILLTLGIVLLGIVNYSNGHRVAEGIVGYEVGNIKNNSIGLIIDKDLNFTTNYGNQSKSNFTYYIASVQNDFFYWSTDGKLSRYKRNYQDYTYRGGAGGTFKHIWICDYLTGAITDNSNWLKNCEQYDYSGNFINSLNEQLSYLQTGDYYYYGNGYKNNDDAYNVSPFLVLNISAKQKAYVLYILNTPNCAGEDQYGLTFGCNNGIYYFTGNKFAREDIPSGMIGLSPIQGGQGGGETNTGNIETTTGQNICIKIQDKINLYGNKYTTSLCRSDGTTNSGGEIIQTGYVNIFTAYPTYQDYANSYKTYQEYCNKNSPRYDYTECKNQLQGLPYGKAGATITRNGIDSQLPITKIYQYCRYQTHFTQEQKNGSGDCEFTDEEIYAPGITGELKSEANGSLIDLVNESLERISSGEYLTPKDGTIFDDILPDGIISWKELISIDFVGNLTKIIAKLLVLFKTRPIVDGILPPVILSLLLLIVLFKMYKK